MGDVELISYDPPAALPPEQFPSPPPGPNDVALPPEFAAYVATHSQLVKALSPQGSGQNTTGSVGE